MAESAQTLRRPRSPAPSPPRPEHELPITVGGDRAPQSDAPTTPRSTGELSPLHEAALRALNFSVALVSLLVLSPLLLAIAVVVKLTSAGPVLYRQIRVGVDRRGRSEQDGTGSDDGSRRTGDLGGVPFAIYKFRTMRVDAEEDSGPTWASPDDDRTTPVGHFLRRHRLDEIPQLWNVIRGDMAIVGPRPERPLFFQTLREQIARYPRRQTVPPGITGWAQINQDSDQSVDDVQRKVRYDLEYLERRSLWFDAWIMIKTPLFMIRRDLLSRPGGDGSSGQEGERAGSSVRAAGGETRPTVVESAT